MMIKMEIPPSKENAIPILFVIRKKTFAIKQKTGYPGKCGCRSTTLYSLMASANLKLSMSSI
jgi:hypothetical protein|tara:strand:- start:843 stop:1028 length:186 start_codon:yes stop_codon:yes gene_type:complete